MWNPPISNGTWNKVTLKLNTCWPGCLLSDKIDTGKGSHCKLASFCFCKFIHDLTSTYVYLIVCIQQECSVCQHIFFNCCFCWIGRYHLVRFPNPHPDTCNLGNPTNTILFLNLFFKCLHPRPFSLKSPRLTLNHLAISSFKVAGLMLGSKGDFSSWLLAATVGVFLYVALVSMLAEIKVLLQDNFELHQLLISIQILQGQLPCRHPTEHTGDGWRRLATSWDRPLWTRVGGILWWRTWPLELHLPRNI